MSERHYTPLFFLKKHLARIRQKRAYLRKQLAKAQARLGIVGTAGLFSRWLRPGVRKQLAAVRRVRDYLMREISRLGRLETEWSGTAAVL